MAAAREEEVAGRRARRAVAQRILDELAVEFL
jgi:hypothetical protein